MTVFNVAASLEIGGRARGGKGLLGWILKLPWGEPSFAAQVLAMIIFMFGGIGGLINASYNINLVIHNTAWVPGHFHLTVGTASTLTFMGILYWLWPHVTGKKLFSRGVALASSWAWFVGMAIFGRGMHWIGLLGAPRRTMLGVTQYFNPEWRVPTIFVGVGGTILFFAAMLFFVNIIGTLFSKRPSTDDMPIAEPAAPEVAPAWLDAWRPWLIGTVALIIMGYGPPLILLISTIQSSSPGFKVW
jgi:cytochrome c oxidase subunit 1